MENHIIYRHNAVDIHSIDSFINIHGIYRKGFRDVYFVIADGEKPNLSTVITETDHRMQIMMRQKQVYYNRIGQLPKIESDGDSRFYQSCYEKWKAQNRVEIKQGCCNSRFISAITMATQKTIAEYKAVRPDLSETMLKNFLIKLWYWTDQLLRDYIQSWDERAICKIIAVGSKGIQAYLFYYMITMLGCDVLILNTREELPIDKGLLRLSAELKLGPYGNVILPDYIPVSIEHSSRGNTIEKKENGEKKTEISAQSSGNAIGSKRNTPKSEKTPAQSVPQREARQEFTMRETRSNAAGNRNDERREKTFEQLAQMASSVVMLAVHDLSGDMVATGSGIMIGREGYILTNYHVVQAGRIYAVRIEDDEKVYLTHEIIKYNATLDLAVIRIDRRLSPLPLYKSKQKLVRGQRVVAIGSPLGLFNSVSDGIISGFRTIKDVEMIQFTAPISSGSSGGAVLNMLGEVIGISTAGIDRGQNINLAVGYKDIYLFASGFLR